MREIVDPKESAARIKDLRKRLGWTQEKLAEECGFHIRTIKFYEAGKRVPHPDYRAVIAKVTGCRADWLVGGEYFNDAAYYAAHPYPSDLLGIAFGDILRGLGVEDSFSELSTVLGDLISKQTEPAIKAFAQNPYLRKLLDENKENLELFRKYSNRDNYTHVHQILDTCGFGIQKLRSSLALSGVGSNSIDTLIDALSYRVVLFAISEYKKVEEQGIYKEFRDDYRSVFSLSNTPPEASKHKEN